MPTFSMKYTYACCVSFYSNASGGDAGACPLGWGNYRNYRDYLPGCYEGRRFPNPVPAHVEITDVIGSPH